MLFNNKFGKINSVARCFIVSEIFFWSAWSTVLPLLSLSVVKSIRGEGTRYCGHSDVAWSD